MSVIQGLSHNLRVCRLYRRALINIRAPPLTFVLAKIGHFWPSSRVSHQRCRAAGAFCCAHRLDAGGPCRTPAVAPRFSLLPANCGCVWSGDYAANHDIYMIQGRAIQVRCLFARAANFFGPQARRRMAVRP